MDMSRHCILWLSFCGGFLRSILFELAGHGIAFFSHTGMAGGLPDIIKRVSNLSPKEKRCRIGRHCQ
jgi:hypothetical protein